MNIATERHMTTTAEGVETARQRDLLRKLGCSEMQGYLFSAPKPAAEIRPLLLAHPEDSAVASPSRARERKAAGPGPLTFPCPAETHWPDCSPGLSSSSAF